jgi:hypothetical protein
MTDATSETGVKEPSTAPAQLPVLPVADPKEQGMRDTARDAWLVMQATAYAYRQNVAWLESLQKWLDVLSVLVAVWLLLVLWGLGGSSLPEITRTNSAR